MKITQEEIEIIRSNIRSIIFQSNLAQDNLEEEKQNKSKALIRLDLIIESAEKIDLLCIKLLNESK